MSSPLTAPQLSAAQQIHTLLTAKHYGGSFYRLLAEAALIADPVNRDTLLTAFPSINATYGPKSVFYREDLG
jgi:hypothetical protein